MLLWLFWLLWPLHVGIYGPVEFAPKKSAVSVASPHKNQHRRKLWKPWPIHKWLIFIKKTFGISLLDGIYLWWIKSNDQMIFKWIIIEILKFLMIPPWKHMRFTQPPRTVHLTDGSTILLAGSIHGESSQRETWRREFRVFAVYFVWTHIQWNLVDQGRSAHKLGESSILDSLQMPATQLRFQIVPVFFHDGLIETDWRANLAGMHCFHHIRSGFPAPQFWIVLLYQSLSLYFHYRSIWSKYYDPISPICTAHIVYISLPHVVVVAAMIPTSRYIQQVRRSGFNTVAIRHTWLKCPRQKGGICRLLRCGSPKVFTPCWFPLFSHIHHINPYECR